MSATFGDSHDLESPPRNHLVVSFPRKNSEENRQDTCPKLKAMNDVTNRDVIRHKDTTIKLEGGRKGLHASK